MLSSRVLRQGERRLRRYQRESFAAAERLALSGVDYNRPEGVREGGSPPRTTSHSQGTYYPGSIRATTPGNTKHTHSGSYRRILANKQLRNYWRPVVDDVDLTSDNSGLMTFAPAAGDAAASDDTDTAATLVTLRIRFKDKVWATTCWETRMHVIEVVSASGATMRDVAEQLRIENRSPYLLQSPIALLLGGASGGRQIHPAADATAPGATVASLGLNECSVIDAVELDSDHLEHLSAHSLKDWSVDEITDADLAASAGDLEGTGAFARSRRYSDLGIEQSITQLPRHQVTAIQGFHWGRF